MSFRPYIIQVSGSVVAKEGKHYTQNWVACACSEGNIEQTSFVYSEKKRLLILNTEDTENAVFQKIVWKIQKKSVILQRTLNNRL